jgi:spore coat polysaccharide biosynthesis protein SpsF (cytidylyltransferase family)
MQVSGKLYGPDTWCLGNWASVPLNKGVWVGVGAGRGVWNRMKSLASAGKQTTVPRLYGPLPSLDPQIILKHLSLFMLSKQSENNNSGQLYPTALSLYITTVDSFTPLY